MSLCLPWDKDTIVKDLFFHSTIWVTACEHVDLVILEPVISVERLKLQGFSAGAWFLIFFFHDLSVNLSCFLKATVFYSEQGNAKHSSCSFLVGLAGTDIYNSWDAFHSNLKIKRGKQTKNGPVYKPPEQVYGMGTLDWGCLFTARAWVACLAFNSYEWGFS